jgi:hypothetical protein
VTDSAPATVHQALTAVMRGVTSVAKRDHNQQGGYNFRGIDAILNAVGPVLREHGVIVVPLVESSDYSTVEVGRNRTQMGYVRVTVTYRWYGPDGSYIDTRTIGEAMDSGDKAAPKAMSVAFRTALLQALALPTDEPDPDSHTYERSERIDPELEALRARALVLRDEALEAVTKDALAAVWKKAGPAVLAVAIPNENNNDEPLGDLIRRRGAELDAIDGSATDA